MLEFLNDELKGIDIRVNEPLKKYTYTKVGSVVLLSCLIN